MRKQKKLIIAFKFENSIVSAYYWVIICNIYKSLCLLILVRQRIQKNWMDWKNYKKYNCVKNALTILQKLNAWRLSVPFNFPTRTFNVQDVILQSYPKDNFRNIKSCLSNLNFFILERKVWLLPLTPRPAYWKYCEVMLMLVLLLSKHVALHYIVCYGKPNQTRFKRV